ncbi:MAG TPA: S24/S26 family peptidase [Polyangia bacterium]|nr:S24/S26 family peptidase [Polyangia bacterium]
MQLAPDALRFVLTQGLPAVIDVTGGSMEPTIARGEKVDVAALADRDPVDAGEIVLVATAAGVLLLHRVMITFDEGGARFVIHQGDAPASSFGVAARRDVLARMTGFASELRALPTLERLDAAARARFRRRRLACQGFLAARRLVHAFRLTDSALVRACAQAYRKLARALAG